MEGSQFLACGIKRTLFSGKLKNSESFVTKMALVIFSNQKHLLIFFETRTFCLFWFQNRLLKSICWISAVKISFHDHPSQKKNPTEMKFSFQFTNFLTFVPKSDEFGVKFSLILCKWAFSLSNDIMSSNISSSAPQEIVTHYVVMWEVLQEGNWLTENHWLPQNTGRSHQ